MSMIFVDHCVDLGEHLKMKLRSVLNDTAENGPPTESTSRPLPKTPRWRCANLLRSKLLRARRDLSRAKAKPGCAP